VSKRADVLPLLLHQVFAEPNSFCKTAWFARKYTVVGPLRNLHSPLRHMANRRPVILALLLFAPLGLASRAADTSPDTSPSDDSDFFESRIRPLLSSRCWGCHSSDDPESGLRLDSRSSMLLGGTRGTAIVPGKPEESLLIHAVNHGEELQMPPKRKLSPRQIADLTEWIERGATWPGATDVSTSAVQPR